MATSGSNPLERSDWEAVPADSEYQVDLWTCTCIPKNPGEEYVIHTTGNCPNCGRNREQVIADLHGELDA